MEVGMMLAQGGTVGGGVGGGDDVTRSGAEGGVVGGGNRGVEQTSKTEVEGAAETEARTAEAIENADQGTTEVAVDGQADAWRSVGRQCRGANPSAAAPWFQSGRCSTCANG